MSDARVNQLGFTLAELLVVLAVAGLLLAAVVTLQMQGQEIYLFGAGRVEAQQSSRAVLDRMAGELRSAQSLTAIGTTSVSFTDFNGSAVQYQLSGATLQRKEGAGAFEDMAAGVQSLALTYRTQAGATTSAPGDVRMIDISITTEPESVGGYTLMGSRTVTVATTVRLRNVL
jgi:prepilin-type N-terminal cleavage/methylation domain-containing protein